jgi:hypothetical protein
MGRKYHGLPGAMQVESMETLTRTLAASEQWGTQAGMDPGVT